MNIRTFKIAILGLLMAVVTHTQAQSSKDNIDAESKFPKNGIRFVVCTASNVQLPSPLYVKVGKDYLPITISSRMPSPRIAPEGGVVRFYDAPPAVKTGNKPPKEQPVLTVEVPEAHQNSSAKSICIVQPSKANDNSPRTYFIKESDFRKGGVYIINFTNSTLEIITDPTGKFEGKEKHTKIAPKINTKNISSKDQNTWVYEGKSASGDKVNYVLQALPVSGRGEPKRIRASVFLTSKDVSQISIVTNHPTLKDQYRLLSVQFADEEDRAKAIRAEQQQQH